MTVNSKQSEKMVNYIAQVNRALIGTPVSDIHQVVNALVEAAQNKAKVFVFGNGGSASTASHFTCDLGKGARIPGLPFMRMISLSDSLPLITAWSNDYSYESVFAEQLANLVDPGDVVIGISGSGNSSNVLKAIHLARTAGATTIGITGFQGGRLKGLVDICVVVPASRIEQVEDCHMILQHVIALSVRDRLEEIARRRREGEIRPTDQVARAALREQDIAPELDAPPYFEGSLGSCYPSDIA